MGRSVQAFLGLGSNLGDRLAYNNGIIVLAAAAIAFIIAFGGQTHALLPLYTVGVFIAFTLSQGGMVMRWRKLGRMWSVSGLVNGLGCITTFIVLIVVTILLTALLAGYESLLRLFRPQPVEHLWAVAGASVVGFLGNEAAALIRIKVGREIGSAALVADGYHARADGLTSLAVLVGAIGVWLGYPLADPMVGLLITVAILHLVWQSARAVFTRILDGVDPEVLDAVEQAARHVPGVHNVAEVRARWIGHRLTLELNVAVNPDLTVTEGHAVAKEVRHQVLHHVPHVSGVTVHVDPATESGEAFHHIDSHAHDGLPVHRHR